MRFLGEFGLKQWFSILCPEGKAGYLPAIGLFGPKQARSAAIAVRS